MRRCRRHWKWKASSVVSPKMMSWWCFFELQIYEECIGSFLFFFIFLSTLFRSIRCNLLFHFIVFGCFWLVFITTSHLSHQKEPAQLIPNDWPRLLPGDSLRLGPVVGHRKDRDGLVFHGMDDWLWELYEGHKPRELEGVDGEVDVR